MTFSWNNGNVDAGLKLGRCVDVVCVTVKIDVAFEGYAPAASFLSAQCHFYWARRL